MSTLLLSFLSSGIICYPISHNETRLFRHNACQGPWILRFPICERTLLIVLHLTFMSVSISGTRAALRPRAERRRDRWWVSPRARRIDAGIHLLICHSGKFTHSSQKTPSHTTLRLPRMTSLPHRSASANPTLFRFIHCQSDPFVMTHLLHLKHDVLAYLRN